jgi:hypothetical protein
VEGEAAGQYNEHGRGDKDIGKLVEDAVDRKGSISLAGAHPFLAAGPARIAKDAVGTSQETSILRTLVMHAPCV